jgi:hypothetical protein
MTNQNRIQFAPWWRLLSVSCEDEAFATMREAIIAHANASELVGNRTHKIHRILIGSAPAVARKRIADRVALVGYGVAASAVLIVLVVGVQTIATWAN